MGAGDTRARKATRRIKRARRHDRGEESFAVPFQLVVLSRKYSDHQPLLRHNEDALVTVANRRHIQSIISKVEAQLGMKADGIRQARKKRTLNARLEGPIFPSARCPDALCEGLPGLKAQQKYTEP